MNKLSSRENNKYYVGTSDKDIQEMLAIVGVKSLADLYTHIPESVRMQEAPKVAPYLAPAELKEHLLSVSRKNKMNTSFLGDGLQSYKVPGIVPKVCSIRGLTTAYTPYQPERSQGTLQTLWIYQNTLAAITGFEAINASLYERATCLYEAINCSLRLSKNKNKVIVASTLHPNDIEVLKTHARHTELELVLAPLDKKTGKLDTIALEKLLDDAVAAVAFPQLTNFGVIEDFDNITNLVQEKNINVIAVVDPMALANTGLKAPAHWGNHGGANLLVAEGQHLTLAPNFGGPGLGIFGIRYNDENKLAIRSTAGRFIGKGMDEKGRECKSIILSTREQHIRREKATSNICSNQSFVASACGAALLSRGDKGLAEIFNTAHGNAVKLATMLTSFDGVDLLFNEAFYNEFTLKINTDVKELIKQGHAENLDIGVNISNRENAGNNLLLVSVSDIQTEADLKKLESFFAKNFKTKKANTIPEIPSSKKRTQKYVIPQFSESELFDYYKKLGDQNLSPDDGIYPLGSCTMKYNPEVNDWAASLEGFTHSHPQNDASEVQGSLEVTYAIQEYFKHITGLPGVTTQPLAGAQGEFVGLKLFQAYHDDQGEGSTRNIVLIPRSAHGTNPATATMAGYESKKVDGIEYGIITIEALPSGEMDMQQLKELVAKYNKRIAGVMVTNPNTAGIFETRFREMADAIHAVGGLVYMDGANMNAIAGWVDLGKLGVDAVHNNLHKTWSIPHGGGGPGDAIVAVSSKLIDFLPGHQVKLTNGKYEFFRTKKSIGSIHRHHGNFAHKVRCYTYLRALGPEGIRQMSAVAVLSARYLYERLKKNFPVLPAGSESTPRMHEFILTLADDVFTRLAANGTPKANAIARTGKLFLDFGFHAPTVAFPEVYGLMIEPTESYSKAELDGFAKVVEDILYILKEYPQTLTTVPHFTPIDKVDEVGANKNPILSEPLFTKLPEVLKDRIDAKKLRGMQVDEIVKAILK